MRIVGRSGSAAFALVMIAGCTSVGPLRSSQQTGSTPCEVVPPVHHDLLILFTDDAIARHGMDVLRANSIESINWTNQAYRNSCVSLRVRVIGTLRSPMQESGTGIIDTQLALRTNARVAALRDEYYADLVLLVSEDRGDGWTGVGSFFYTHRHGVLKAVDSFAVVKAPALTGLTVAHELGHMQGLDHDRENASAPLPGNFHYGFRVCADDGFRDIMSMGCPNDASVPAIQQYSNPRLTYNGYKTGVDPAEDPANAADAARGLDDMAVFIAMFREPPVAATDVRGINDAEGQGTDHLAQPVSPPDR
ncbi:MAG TPA: M12 family metallo-peptidase [Steroidobacteraceae bacterium]